MQQLGKSGNRQRCEAAGVQSAHAMTALDFPACGGKS
jgi:hypothetical protein